MKKETGWAKEHDWIRESNLIEGVDSQEEDVRSLKAWNWLQGRSWSMETILGLHGRIMCVLDQEIAGKIRNCSVWVGGRKCPDHSNVKGMLEDWVERLGDIKHDDTIKSAHVAFEHIHPFQDGNGRTGRMLMNWQRVRAGMEPFVVRADERWDYYKWFEERQ